MIVKMEMPNPMPYSSNCDVSACWKINNNTVLEQENQITEITPPSDNQGLNSPDIMTISDIPMSKDADILVG